MIINIYIFFSHNTSATNVCTIFFPISTVNKTVSNWENKIVDHSKMKDTKDNFPPWSTWSRVLMSSLGGGEDGRGAVRRGIPLDSWTSFISHSVFSFLFNIKTQNKQFICEMKNIWISDISYCYCVNMKLPDLRVELSLNLSGKLRVKSAYNITDNTA